jgi:O-antigen/teichoic acid export membrane protein
MMKQKREKSLATIFWLSVALGLLLNFSLIPLLGLKGGLISTGIVQVFMLLLFIRFDKKK